MHRINYAFVWLTVIAIPLLNSSDADGDDAILAKDASLTLEGKVAFVEGPAWHPSGSVFFSDILNNRIMRRDRTGVIHTYRTPSGRTNGLCFDKQGRLICCEGGGAESNRRVTRLELDGTITVLAAHYNGRRINSPNDCTMDAEGRIYFTDPRYRSKEGVEQRDSSGKIIEGVYRIDDVGKVTRILEHEVSRPNGIAISPDQMSLYIAENKNDGAKPHGRKLWRFDLRSDGSVRKGSGAVLFDWKTDRGPDGMAIDVEGNLYVTAGFNHPTENETANQYKAGVYVISSKGKLLKFIPIPTDMITNCAFGDEDLKTLYVTAGHRLWSIRTQKAGYVEWLRQSASPLK